MYVPSVLGSNFFHILKEHVDQNLISIAGKNDYLRNTLSAFEMSAFPVDGSEK